jgi:hypothetical protein
MRNRVPDDSPPRASEDFVHGVKNVPPVVYSDHPTMCFSHAHRFSSASLLTQLWILRISDTVTEPPWFVVDEWCHRADEPIDVGRSVVLSKQNPLGWMVMSGECHLHRFLHGSAGSHNQPLVQPLCGCAALQG